MIPFFRIIEIFSVALTISASNEKEAIEIVMPNVTYALTRPA